MKLPDYLTESNSQDLQELIDHFRAVEGNIDQAFYEFTGDDLDSEEFPELAQACININNLIAALKSQRDEAIEREEEKEEEEGEFDIDDGSYGLSPAERNRDMVAEANRTAGLLYRRYI